MPGRTWIVGWLQAVPQKVGQFFSSGWESVKSITSEKWEAVKTAAIEKGTAMVDWIKQLPGKIKAFFADAAQWLVQAGRDLIGGMIRGVQEKAGELLNAARNVVSNAVKGVTNFLDSHSPSRLTRDEVGGPLVDGVIVGVLAKEAALVASVGKVIQAAVKTAKAGTATIGKALDDATKPLAPGGPGSKPAPLPVLTGTAYSGTAGPSAAAMSGDLLTTPGTWDSFGQGGSSGGVTVNMSGVTVREEADIRKIGQQFSFQMAVAG